MASYTTNLNLKKPAGSENVAIGDINNNMDNIDQAFGTLNSIITQKVNYSDITFDVVSGSANTPTLLGGCKFEAMSFDSGRTGGFTFNYNVFAFIVIGRGDNVGVYLLDGFSNVITIKEGANINITCSNKTGNITVTNASYQYGFVMYA